MTTLLVVVVLIAGVSWGLRPVCISLSKEDLAHFNVPIEQRRDRDIYLEVFQFRNGQWDQCKTWLSRQFFFLTQTSSLRSANRPSVRGDLCHRSPTSREDVERKLSGSARTIVRRVTPPFGAASADDVR
jgi:hypothetical protein